MADAPPVSSGTRERQSNASSMLKNEINEAIINFMSALDDIARKYEQ
jgi:hypothetical protein